MPECQPTDGEKKVRPCRFYKFRDFRNPPSLERAILKHEFFFGSPDNFNDPFECLPSFSFEATEEEMFEYFRRIVARNFPDLSDQQQFALAHEHRSKAERELRPGTPEHKAYIEGYIKSVHPKLPIFCVSATNKNVLLWSHYAYNHTGVCLQFDANSPDLNRAHQVVYRTERPTVNLIAKTPKEQMEDALLVKAKDWAYEEEWRVVSIGNSPGIHVFKAETLTGIIFGHNTDPADKQVIRTWLEMREAPVRLMQANISASTYEVDIQDC